MTLEYLKYPLGKFEKPEVITGEQINDWIAEISSFPGRLQNEVHDLTDEELDRKYREGGWTVRQVVHHCADSHINSFCRFKLALTETKPIIKPYHEERWAETIDGKSLPVDPSVSILMGLHNRWSLLLASLKKDELSRTFIHPEHGQEISLAEAIGMYAWHCNHHLAHISIALQSV